MLNSVQICVSTADLITGFPIQAPDGSLTSPTYSFASNIDSGILRASTGVSLVVDGVVGMVAAASSNVGVGAIPSTYGGGEGVLFLADASVNPVGALGSAGGILYVSGADLVYLDAVGTTTILNTGGTSDVTGPASSLDEEVARYGDTFGGSITPSGVIFSGTQLRVGTGTSSVPSYSFTSDPDTGMYLSGSACVFGFESGSKMSLSASTTLSTVMAVVDGNATTPSLTFTSNTGTGLYFDGADVGFAAGGVGGLRTGGLRNSVLADATATGFGTGAQGVVKIATSTTDPVGVPNAGSGGVLYAPGGTQLRWLDASGTTIKLGGNLAGVGTVNDGQLLVWNDTTATSAAARSVITDGGAIAAVQSATLTNPAYSFTGDTTTGMGRAGAGHLRGVGGGVTYMDMTASQILFSQPVMFAQPSTVGAPAMSFSAETTTGCYTGAPNLTRLSYSSSGVAQFHSTNNTVICTEGAAFGGGQGMFGISDAVTNPTTAPINGGFLYVDGTDLKWRDTTNTEVRLTTPSIVESSATSTNNAMVRFDGAAGTGTQDSFVTISDDGQVTAVAAEGYRFVSSPTSGFFGSGGDTLALASAGTTGLTLTASSLRVSATHVLSGPDGTVSAPSLSFASDSTTGVYLATTQTTALSTGGVRAVSVGPTNNVAFGADTPDFATGQGVVYLSDVTVAPAGALASGGILYVSGTDLYFHATSGTVSTITEGMNRLGSTTDNALFRFDGVAGNLVQDTPALTITDGGQVLVPNGAAGAPAYSLEVGTTGISLNGSTLQIGSGGAHLSVSSAAIVASVAFEADAGLRVSGGMTETFSSSTATRTIADVEGTFVWNQNGIPIMQTTTTRDLNMLTHNVGFSGGAGTATLAYDGSEYALSSISAADSVGVRIGSTDVLAVSQTNVTFNNLEVTTGRVIVKAELVVHIVGSGYSFSNAKLTTLFASTVHTALINEGVIGMRCRVSSKAYIMQGTLGPDGSRITTIKAVLTEPTGPPTSGSGVYMYVTASAQFVRVTNQNRNVTLNGPLARAKFTRTASIPTGTDTLINTLVNDTVVSNILVMNTGAGTVTGTVDTVGLWEVTAAAHWAHNTTGYRKVRILIGGVEVAIATQNAVTVATVETRLQVAACVNVVASAVMTVRVEQNSGGNLGVNVIASAVFLG